MCFFYVTVTDGESMENTLQDRQLFIVQRLAYTIERGDIVTVNTAADDEEEHLLIKRVLGISGDKLIFMKSAGGGHIELYRRNCGSSHYELLDEPYLKEAMSISSNYYATLIINHINGFTEIDFSADPAETARYEKAAISVPDDSIYFLGDNRNESLDSRFYGTRTKNCVRGKLVKIVNQNSSTEAFLKFIYSLN